MMMMMNSFAAMALLIVTVVVVLPMIDAYQIPKVTTSLTTARTSTTTQLSMVPKFVGNKWVPQDESDTASAGYDVIGTLLRQGPEPTITRIFSNDDYEQAVLKFMATENCDRNTAQGNIDAYLRNPPDYAYVRSEDKKRNFQRDYVTLKPIEVTKVIIWSTIVFGLIGRTIYAITTGNRFNL